MQFRELTDRYQLHKILKSSRFGTVLQATDIPSGRTVAVKLITVGPSPGLAAAAPEFTRLAATLAALGHPNLPSVLDHGFTSDGSAFLVLELLEGKTLDSLNSVPPARLLSLVGQALNGLETLARHGLSHHNLSPDNLFVAQGPEGERVVLLGLGTSIFRPRGSAATAENARFLAPELAAGGPADWRADLYSLALAACTGLGATVGFGEPPVVQLPLAVSFELESDEALRQTLERALRQRASERPAPQDLRQALHLAIGDAAAPAPPYPPAAKIPFVAPPLAAPAVAPSPPAAVPLPVAHEVPPLLEIPQAMPPIPAAKPPAQPPPELLAPPPSPAETETAAAGDVLSAVDDEILNALLSVPAPPPRPVEAAVRGAQAAKAGVPAQPAAAPAGKPLLKRPAVLGALAGVTGLGIAAVAWLLWRPQPEAPAPPPPPPPVVLAKLPTEPPLARLEEAKLHVAQGEDLMARRVLRSILFGEQGLLSAQGCRELGAIEETLARAGWERLPADVANGLKSGDLETLQSVVAAGSGREAELAPEAHAEFDRARSIVAAYEEAGAAAARKDHVQVLERFAAVADLMPQISDPDDLREKAALALEAAADELVQAARYAEALARLGPIQRTWPDRPGLSDRIARYQTFQENERKQEALLAALPALERRKKPWDGLQMLSGIEPTPHLAPRFAEARKRLETLLAQLDNQPPQLVLRDGYLLEYARGTVAELSFRATDDYQVQTVKLMARPEGGKFKELALETTRTGYSTVAIDPSFHRNGTVELFVVATDFSGHETYLGSADKPLQLKRKQGFERLIR